MYLLEPPDANWRAMAIVKGQIWLGELSFPLEPFDFQKDDGGS